jgi:methionine biosynthesis protein MetW
MVRQETTRADFQRIVDLVPEGKNVIDLGCGNGALLQMLRDQKNAAVQGVEISIEGVNACIEKGINVFHGDIMDGIKDFANQSFDFVILSQTLHELLNPEKIILEMLRVGRQAIVSFYNLAYFRYRMEFFFKGGFPKDFPYTWKNTYASIITVKDFKAFCTELRIDITDEIYLDYNGNAIGPRHANNFAKVALIVLQKPENSFS